MMSTDKIKGSDELGMCPGFRMLNNSWEKEVLRKEKVIHLLLLLNHLLFVFFPLLCLLSFGSLTLRTCSPSISGVQGP